MTDEEILEELRLMGRRLERDRFARAANLAADRLEKLAAERDVLHAQLAEASSVLRSLLGWMRGPECADCHPYRRSPADIEWSHEDGCGALEAMNRAYTLLKLPPDIGHKNESGIRAQLAERTRERDMAVHHLGRCLDAMADIGLTNIAARAALERLRHG